MVKKQGITLQDIQAAKDVPLETLIQINAGGFASCLFHKDKTPSLKVYKQTNRWHCFSCGEGSDTIDLIIKTQKMSFVEAVKFLIHK